MRNYVCPILLGIVTIVLASCTSQTDRKVTVQRSAFNRPALKVTSAPPGKADEILIEEQGYVEAQDRFLQMDTMRRLSRGTLSEVYGAAALGKDTTMISVGLPMATVNSTEKIKRHSPEAYALLEAFARGVNRFIAEIESNRPEILRYYRQYTKDLKYRPAPWEPADSVAIGELVAFQMSSEVRQKGILTMISAAFSDKDEFAQRFDMRPMENVFITRAKDWLPIVAPVNSTPVVKLSDMDNSIGEGFDCVEMAKGMGMLGQKCFNMAPYGSNNWVVSKQFAGAENSYLANDPHLQLTFPTTMYEMALDSTAAGGTLRVRGMNLPGVPGILIGHNENVAWGMTNLGADVDDLYLDKLNDAQTAVKFKRGEVPLAIQDYAVKVRNLNGGIDIQNVRLRIVPHHGPILSDHNEMLKNALKKIGGNKVMSYKWTGHPGTLECLAIFGANRAKSAKELVQAFGFMETGAENVVYSDRLGNIGYYAHGNFPVRKYVSKSFPPFVALDGMTGRYEWDGYQAEVPQVHNPAWGYVVTANNDPYGDTLSQFPADGSKYIGAMDFTSGNRAYQISKLLNQNKGKITADVLRKIQFNKNDHLAEVFVAYLRDHAAKLNLGAKEKEFVQRLVAWCAPELNCPSDKDLEEPVLFDHWLRNLLMLHFADLVIKVPALAGTGYEYSSLAIKTMYHKIGDGLREGAPANVQKNTYAILEQSLKAAERERAEEGKKVWGDINRLEFANPLEGIIPTFMHLSFPRSGSWETVDPAGGWHGPSFRLVMVLNSKGIEGYNVLAGGNFDPTEPKGFLRELMMWLNGEQRELVPFVS